MVWRLEAGPGFQSGFLAVLLYHCLLAPAQQQRLMCRPFIPSHWDTSPWKYWPVRPHPQELNLHKSLELTDQPHKIQIHFSQEEESWFFDKCVEINNSIFITSLQNAQSIWHKNPTLGIYSKSTKRTKTKTKKQNLPPSATERHTKH